MFQLKIILVLLFFSHYVNSQRNKDSVAIEKIEKWDKVSKGKYDSVSFINHHKMRYEAKRISSLIWEAEAYMSLAWYHGNGHVKERRLDSTLYYFSLFESKIPELKAVNNKKAIFYHYLNKGNTLVNRFGLIEEGMKAYNNGYVYIDNASINLKTYYDIFMSQVYNSKGQVDKSLSLLSTRLKDTVLLDKPCKLYLMQNLANSYKLNKKHESSLALNQRILTIAERDDNEYYIWWTKKELCNNYFLLGNTQKALNEALPVRDHYLKNTNKDALIDLANYLGDFYYANGDIDTAIKYKEEALAREYSINDLPFRYGELAKLYSENKNTKKARFFYDKKDKINDSIRGVEQALLITYSDASIQFLKQKKINDDIANTNQVLKIKNKEQQDSLTLLWVFLLCLVIIFIAFYFIRKRKKSLEELRIEEKKNILEKQVKLRDEELELSTKALSSNISSLNQIKEELERVTFTDAEKIKKTSKEIVTLINSTSNLSMVTDKIASKYSSFTILLKEKHPNLSTREVDYCLLTKLNLSIKETASILNVSPGTVKVARSRLKTKMSISSKMSLKEYLNSIDNFPVE